VSVRDLVVALVPRDWTGEQALRAVRALNEAIEGIWLVHGEAMAALLFEEPSRDDTPRELDDDIPF
jgi:hypothetical protein